MRDLKPVLHLLVMAAILAAVGVFLAPRDLSQAQDFGVTVTPNRERINVRIGPAIGHEVIGTLSMGQVVPATGRTSNGEWLRINYFGQEGWVGRVVVTVSGNMDALPIGAPTVLPFDLGDGPRAGPSNATGGATIRLPESGIRLRAGPSELYFMIANVPRYEVLAATGRSPDGQWLQVNYRGTLGWIANLGELFIEWQRGSITDLPEWGILADGPPVNQPVVGPSATRDALMTAMLLHIDVSTNRLDVIAGIWNTISMGGTRVCSFGLGHPQPYIPRDVDLSTYPELDPVIAALNEGLEETGRAIDLWEQWCESFSQNYPIPPDLVNSGLEAIRNARTGFASARAQILALGLEPTPTPLPPALTPAPQVPTVTAPAALPDLMAFGLAGNRVVYTTQFTHPDLGCNWQGLGGQVLGMQGEPLTGFTIRVEGVTDPTLVLETVSGAETAYGPSGWELQLAGGPNSHVYRVTLYQGQRRVSDPKVVAFPNDCARNLGIMNFNQLTPLE